MKIIGGKAKGTNLLAPVGRNTTRPTLGRVRESIFNVLTNVGLIETDVLDIFAGTGAMGLEALSRYASSAVFIDKTTGRIIRENAKKCHVEDQVQIISREVGAALKSLQGRTFDYIFMDPPYRKGYINEVLAMVFDCGLPADHAIIIAEHSISEPRMYHSLLTSVKSEREKSGAIVVTYLLCRSTEEKCNENSDLPRKFRPGDLWSSGYHQKKCQSGR